MNERIVTGVMVIYECNDGPVAYGPFAHVVDAQQWTRERMKAGDEFSIIPYHAPVYWDE